MTVPSQPTLESERSRKRLSADAVQTLVLVLIVTVVGLMAGAASFTHVHDWTIDNSPAGTPDWFGWANAVISELIPTASIIEVARRRRRNKNASVRYPMVLLVAAVCFSLTAQLAVAKPGLSGWIVSALPALAFLGLSKFVFSATAHRSINPVAADTPATSLAPSSDTALAMVRPAAASTTRATAQRSTSAKKAAMRRSHVRKPVVPVAGREEQTEPAAADPTPLFAEVGKRYPDLLLTQARTIATAHHDEHGEPINPNQMAVRLRVPTPVATDILTHLENHPTAAANTQPHNGRTIAEVTA